MMGYFRSAFVIGRRDFMATVYSRTFIFFLLGPLLIIGISALFGNVAGQAARQDLKTNVAVVGPAAQFATIKASRDRLNPAFGDPGLPELIAEEPDYDPSMQVQDLLGARDKRIIAVLTGNLDHPTLTGAIEADGPIMRQMRAIIGDARAHAALGAQGRGVDDAPVKLVKVKEAAGSLIARLSTTARFGQLLLFTITVLLSGMLLSNLIEEKSNKVIEVLAAAVPIDAIFVGKLFSMLAVSLVGICAWATGAIVVTMIWSHGGLDLTAPAVGWPIFVVLVLLYYSANYLLLGALFLGIGSQASSIREVQTLSMPVTVGQMLVFLLASLSVGQPNGPLGILAAVFPFSSPMTMIARAAQSATLWPHLLALAWQALWVWLTILGAASLFRRNVMKAGGGISRTGRRRAAQT